MTGRTRVAILGLGTIGRVHREVLGALDGVSVAFAVDPRAPAGGESGSVPLLPDLDTALTAYAPPAVVVVATPTGTHLDVVSDALRRTRALVLCEKPLTDDADALARFEASHRDDLDRLRVVNHFAFSPEVQWAAALVRREGWGAPSRIFSSFNDPYFTKPASERGTYVSSWVDSGSNQLSMLGLFASGWTVLSHDAEGELRSATQLRVDGGTATLVSSWCTGDSSKHTVLRWPEGVELFLDHTAMSGCATLDGAVIQHVGHDGTTGRKAAHYSAMYRALLAGADEELLSLALARRVASLLTEAHRCGGAGAGVTWARASGASFGAASGAAQ